MSENSHNSLSCPKIFALFQKRIEGDDALLRLAALRCKEAGLGAEYYAETPDELEWLLSFRPFPSAPVVVHLSREINLFEESGRKSAISFARGFENRVYGFVLHDQGEITTRFDEYSAVLEEMEADLQKIKGCPYLFIEYAAGLAPDVFIDLFRKIAGLEKISACIDIGHIGLWQAQAAFSHRHPGKDICAVKPSSPELSEVIDDVVEAVNSAPDAVLKVIQELGKIGKPLHFHLHDAHPLSTFSVFGVSDHLSFLTEIPVPFEYKGRRHLKLMFGPFGLLKLISESLRILGPERVTFSLEIHPTEGRLYLGNASYLFNHWVDKGNAERMNRWLSVIRMNHELVMKSCRPEDAPVKRPEKVIVYNLFPLLAGKFTDWESHLLRASLMGFTWVFINPIHPTGRSGSIYSITDYFSFNPVYVDPECEKPPQEQARDMVRTAERLGLKIMVDLVINHCSVDSPLIREHPEWFQWDHGRIVNPSANEDGRRVVWKDLASFDHRNTKDKEGLFRFFFSIITFLAELGCKGFRCDAAYQLPKGLWERLIGDIKKSHPDLYFFAETLGSPSDLTRKMAGAGFDYIFNSSKWWDFRSSWLMQQYALTRDMAPSISFPESHDTARLCEELNGNLDGIKQRYLFSALFSGGVMMPMGYEFCFRKRLHVVRTRPEDWEETCADLTSFITEVNRIKAEHLIFQEDAPTEILAHGNPNVLFMWKGSTRSQEESLLILNKDIYNRQEFYVESLRQYVQAGSPLTDISPENRLDYIPAPFSYELMPGQGIVLMSTRDKGFADEQDIGR